MTLVLLAGNTEAGKSTAGRHLATRGVQRLEIRNLLPGLMTGRLVEYDDVATREDSEQSDTL